MALYLLDANVLLAIAWPNHPFHQRAVARIEQSRQIRWATCLLTQAAFIRLSSNPAAVPAAKSPAEAGQMLEALIADSRHVFLEARSTRVGTLVDLLRRCHGHNQVNDAFLVWLAITRKATLLSFDAQIKHLSSTAGAVEIVT